MAVQTKELKELPPLSSSAREILKIVYKDDVDISVFVRIVESDPVLLARIIGLANSAFYGVRATVTSVQRAIIDVLGFRTAKNIALGVVLGGIFNPKSCRAFDLPKYWLISLLTATLSRDIIVESGLTSLDANDAYLTGMLNEIGVMALAYLHPIEMEQVLSDNADDKTILATEMEIFGDNHYAISMQLMSDWKLPDIVNQIMLESVPDSEQKAGDLCQIIHFSRMIANKIYEQKTIDLEEFKLPTIISQHSSTIDSIISNTKIQVDAYQEMANLLS